MDSPDSQYYPILSKTICLWKNSYRPVSNGNSNLTPIWEICTFFFWLVSSVGFNLILKFCANIFQANWFKASQYCRFHGMHLASISSQEENDRLEKHIKDFGEWKYLQHLFMLIWIETWKTHSNQGTWNTLKSELFLPVPHLLLRRKKLALPLVDLEISSREYPSNILWKQMNFLPTDDVKDTSFYWFYSD